GCVPVRRVFAILTSLMLILFFAYWFIQFYSKEPDEQVGNTSIPSNSTSYDINLDMIESGVFQVSADILIKNDSQESWADIAFHFVPNAMNPELTAGYSGESAGVEMNSITSGEDELRYELGSGALFIELESDL